MPTYQYQCRQCAHVAEKFHGMQESPRVACPQCGGLTQRIITQPRTVVSSSSEVESVEPKDSSDTHDCGTGCALHQSRYFE